MLCWNHGWLPWRITYKGGWTKSILRWFIFSRRGHISILFSQHINMRSIFLKVLFLAIVINIHGFVWYKPQHIFDKVSMIVMHLFSLSLSLICRIVQILYGRHIFHMGNMKDFGILNKFLLNRINWIWLFQHLYLRWGHKGHLHPAYIQWGNTDQNIKYLWRFWAMWTKL